MRGVFFLLSILALSVPVIAADGPAGQWRSDFGLLELVPDLGSGLGSFVGTYDTPAGRVEGALSDGVLSGFWVQTTSRQRCATPLLGSRHWGRFVFRFAGDRFEGHWSYCEAEPTKDRWTGVRLREGDDPKLPPDGRAAGPAQRP